MMYLEAKYLVNLVSFLKAMVISGCAS